MPLLISCLLVFFFIDMPSKQRASLLGMQKASSRVVPIDVLHTLLSLLDVRYQSDHPVFVRTIGLVTGSFLHRSPFSLIIVVNTFRYALFLFVYSTLLFYCRHLLSDRFIEFK